MALLTASDLEWMWNLQKTKSMRSLIDLIAQAHAFLLFYLHGLLRDPQEVTVCVTQPVRVDLPNYFDSTRKSVLLRLSLSPFTSTPLRARTYSPLVKMRLGSWIVKIFDGLGRRFCKVRMIRPSAV